MKKTISIILSSVLLFGCATQQPKTNDVPEEEVEDIVEVNDEFIIEGLNILAPSGAPALSLLPIMMEGKNNFNIVNGPDPLQAELVTPNSEYDVVIAPTNLGVKLATANQTDYRLYAVVSWGNLYIVSENENALEEEGTLAAFGEQAVSGLVFQKEYESIVPEITWYPSVQEAQQILLSGQADVALLAEPVATATIAKAKEDGKELKIITDLQENWGEGGYPQAGLFIKENDYENNQEVYDALIQKLVTTSTEMNQKEPEEIAQMVDQVGVEQLGVPNSTIIGKTWKRMNIQVVPIDECKDTLTDFLALFGISVE